jgi:enamine deaminase RidA (YjgF/YER057c/UK114 family)
MTKEVIGGMSGQGLPYFFPENAPARSTVRADLMIDAKIELGIIAYKP